MDQEEAVLQTELARHHAFVRQEVPAPVTALDPMDQIRKLADLHRDGIVSDAEFEAKKQQLLGL
jgi:hypothetical protein